MLVALRARLFIPLIKLLLTSPQKLLVNGTGAARMKPIIDKAVLPVHSLLSLKQLSISLISAHTNGV